MNKSPSAEISYESACLKPRIEGSAIASLILSMLSGAITAAIVIAEAIALNLNIPSTAIQTAILLLIALLPEIAAVIWSILALRRIAKGNGRLRGTGLAIAALIIGVLSGPAAFFGAIWLIDSAARSMGL